MKRRTLLFCIIIFCFALGAENAGQKPTLIIGGDKNYPPYEFINSQGQADGYNVELSRLICKELGYKPVFRLSKWSLVRDRLVDGSIDLVQGMAYSLQRASDLEFSNAHTRTWRGILRHKRADLRNLRNNPDLQVAVQEDDIAADYLKQIGFKGTVIRIPNPEEALKLLDEGIFDAMITNYMTALYIIKEEGLKNVKAMPQRIHQRDYCYASLDKELILSINSVLQDLDNNGELQKLQSKWLGGLDDDEWTADRQNYVPSWAMWALLSAFIAALGLLIHYYLRLRRWRKELTNCRILITQRQFYGEVYKDLFEKGRIIIYRLDYSNQRLLNISDSVQEWGYNREEMLYMQKNDIVYIEDQPRYSAFFDSLNARAHSMVQYRILTRSGELRWVMDYAKLYLSDTGEETLMLGYLIDITDHKVREVQLYNARERADSEVNAKNHFCSVMSHEIRNAVNGSFGFIQVLRQMNKDPEIEELLAYLYGSELAMLKTLDNMLDYSKIDSGKMNLFLSNFDLKRLITETVKANEAQMMHKAVKLEYKISEELPQILFGDQLRLKQIFTNLLQNAQKFTESGKIEFAAELYTKTENEIRILFKVEDSGIGIQQQRLKDIFENYTQAEDTIGLKYGGTGLGLAIVKRLVELMQGFIWVESEPGKGSCFYFIIPFAIKVPGKEPDAFIQAPKIPKRSLLRGRVLLGDNNKMLHLFASKLLQMWGLKVDIAEDGEEVIRMHKEKLYDFILVSSQLRVIDAVGICHEIRHIERVLQRKTPIIASVESETEEEIMYLKASGIDECIKKPVNLDLLYEMLSKYLPKADE